MPFYAGDPNRFPTAWQTDPSQGSIATYYKSIK